MQVACKFFLLFFLFIPLSNSFCQVPNGCGTIHEPVNNQQNQQNQSNAPCSHNINAFPFNDINVIPNTNDPEARLKVHLNFIFVQKDDGSLMFDMGNPEHSTLFNDIVDHMNYMVSNLQYTDACLNSCPEDFISDLRIEFIPHFTQIQNTFYWNHENDTPFFPNARNKPFLNEIVALARMEESYYEEGFDLIYTAEGTEAEEQLLYPDVYHWNLPSHNISNIFQGGAVAYSMFPSTNHQTNMQLHMTNSYRQYLSNIFNQAWLECEDIFWNLEQEAIDQAEGLMHEIGHGLGLSHGSACRVPCPTDDNPNATKIDPTNISSGSGCERVKLNGCQINTIWNRFMTTNLRSIVDCEEAHLVDYIVDEDMTWSNSLYLYGDVIVTNNATLTVTCELFFSEDRSIIVEKGSRLILDGALLSNMDNCDYKWRGIKVVGDDDSFDFDVVVKNGSRIENAVEAINMFPPIAWPEVQNFGNGTVKATDSFFTNNNKDIGFIAFHPIFNNSVIDNCTFTGARESITNWNCQGIHIKNNSRFEEITETAITSGSGSFVLEGNYFQSEIQDILMLNASSAASWDIQENTFEGTTGILHEGAPISTHLIKLNTFLSEDQAMFVDGLGSYNFEFNTLNDVETGVVCFNSVFTNSIKGNTFNSCRTGINYEDNNNGSSFTENCFVDSRQDVYISGEVSDLIGSFNNEAGNCFSDDKIQTFPDPNAGIPGIVGVHEHFTYFLYEDNALNCKDVDQTQNFDIVESNNEVNPCDPGTGGVPPENPWPFPIEDPVNFEDPITDDERVLSSINGLFDLRTNIAASEIQYKQEALKIVSRKIDQLSQMLAEYYVEELEFEKARVVLENVSSEYKPLFLFSIDLFENDLDRAHNTLDNISAANEEWIDFKKTQIVNLAFLGSAGNKASVSPEDINELRNIGLKGHPLSSYARGLYTIITGIRLTSPLPDREVVERSMLVESSPSSIQKSFVLYPNVTNSTFRVETNGYEGASFAIYDIQGNKMEKGIVRQDHSVNVSDWAQGTYIYVLYEEGKISEKQLIVVTK